LGLSSKDVVLALLTVAIVVAVFLLASGNTNRPDHDGAATNLMALSENDQPGDRSMHDIVNQTQSSNETLSEPIGTASTSLVVSTVVEIDSINGMTDWLVDEFVPSLQGRQIEDLNIVSIDSSLFVTPLLGSSFVLNLSPDMSVTANTQGWHPTEHGGGSWFGHIDGTPSKVSLHVDLYGRIRGKVLLPNEVWVISTTDTPPYHVAYRLIDTAFYVD
jgi:hypothetical protein